MTLNCHKVGVLITLTVCLLALECELQEVEIIICFVLMPDVSYKLPDVPYT